jgi:type 1 glutamine amidotransferase
MLNFPIKAVLAITLTIGWTAPAQTDAADSDEPLTYHGAAGPGSDLTIVLIAGDEEYRSEEALPQFGKILALRHGFTCKVLFSIDPDTGDIDPNNRHNIPCLEALDTADLMIIATRFRDLPDDQMRHIDAFVRSGKPVIGLRTATHAFAIESSQTYASYSWNADRGGFGREILGETWIAHHGNHGNESTRGEVAPGAADHPIARGLAANPPWGPTDVYAVRLPLPEGCQPVVLGRVLAGMDASDPPVEGDKNDPMMPIAWTRTFPAESSKPERVFTTTMGAATDLASPGTRIMLVNAVYWALGLETDIPQEGTAAGLIGEYEPSPFGFNRSRPGVKPADHKLEAEPKPAPD